MHIAIEDLQLHRLIVISPGTHSFPLTKDIDAIALEKYLST